MSLPGLAQLEAVDRRDIIEQEGQVEDPILQSVLLELGE